MISQFKRAFYLLLPIPTTGHFSQPPMFLRLIPGFFREIPIGICLKIWYLRIPMAYHNFPLYMAIWYMSHSPRKSMPRSGGMPTMRCAAISFMRVVLPAPLWPVSEEQGKVCFSFNIIQVLWIVHQQIQHIILMFKFLEKQYIYQTLRMVPGYVGHVWAKTRGK